MFKKALRATVDDTDVGAEIRTAAIAVRHMADTLQQAALAVVFVVAMVGTVAVLRLASQRTQR